MTTIVMNTLTGAVSEYDWAFQSMTPTHAGSAAGLFELGGGDDDGDPITGEIRTGFHNKGKVLMLGNAYVSVNSTGDGVFVVQGNAASWEYSIEARDSGVSKATPGKGIRENSLAFGYRNTAGADFHIDRIEVDVIESKTRKV